MLMLMLVSVICVRSRAEEGCTTCCSHSSERLRRSQKLLSPFWDSNGDVEPADLSPFLLHKFPAVETKQLYGERRPPPTQMLASLSLALLSLPTSVLLFSVSEFEGFYYQGCCLGVLKPSVVLRLYPTCFDHFHHVASAHV